MTTLGKASRSPLPSVVPTPFYGSESAPVNNVSVSERLADLPLFQNCDENLLDAIAEQARHFDLKADEEIELKDGGPLFIVQHGALRFCIGAGPAIIVGPGAVLNCAGFLGVLGEADAYRPRRDDTGRVGSKGSKDAADEAASPYTLVTNKSAPPPTLFVERKKMSVSTDKKTQKLGMDEICFYNLCPHAAVVGLPSRRPSGWMLFKITGAAAGAEPLHGDARHTAKTAELGGARIACISSNVLDVIGRSGKLQPGALRRFQENSQQLKKVFDIVLKRCGVLFPSVPPQVMWAIAEMSDVSQMIKGDYIVSENDVGDDAEALKILEEGTLEVEKMVGVSTSHADVTVIGQLSPGAIIGDMCLLGATIPRPASARASTRGQVLTIPMQGMFSLIRHYPGILAGMGTRLRSVAGFLQTTLPLCAEVLSSMNLFAVCDVALLRAISGERRAFFGGHTFDDEEDLTGMVYAVEYGRCGLECPGQDEAIEIPVGKCFGIGEPAMIGCCEVAKGAVVRVVTPIAIVLQMDKKGLAAVFERFQAEKQRFERVVSAADGGWAGGVSDKIDVFRECGQRFVDNIFSALEMKCYMTGQTVVVMGAQDASQMFILKSGHVELEAKGGKVVKDMHTGATFGEMVMLGVTRRRTITIRATTMCFTMEIPRATFLSAMAKNPEERARFEQLAMRNMDLDSAVIWPVLRGCPERMLLLLNLHAERRMCAAKDPFLATPHARDCALLLLQGKASIWNPAGEEVQPLGQGECFNEQILLGVPNAALEFVVPKTACEIQIVTKQAWDKVCDEFPAEQDRIRKSIQKHMAERAEFRLGVAPGSTTMLKSSALFRGTSEPFVQAVRDRLKNSLYRPGRTIIEAGRDGDGFYLLLDGTAQATLRNQTFELTSGANFGEAVLIGIVKAFQKTVRATTMCLVQRLRKADFRECLQQHTGDQRYFELPVLEAEKEGHDILPNRVRNSVTFEDCDSEFLDLICPHVDDQFFMPQEKIIVAGDDFVLGVSFVYVLLAGQAVAEDELGVTLGIVNVGEIIGEAPLVGVSSGKRTANVRAWSRGLVHCAKIPSGVLNEQLQRFQREKEVLVRLCRTRHEVNLELIARRTMWLNEVAVPSLRHSILFSWCDGKMMKAIAAHLAETVYAPGEVIVAAGDDAKSMIVVLEGVADLESKCGMNVGWLTGGAIIGEVAVMGIFATRTATVRAYHRCRVIQLDGEVIHRSVPGIPNSPEIIAAKLGELADGRHLQISQGLPLCALPLGIPADDVCVRAVALQAVRIDLEAGDFFEPLSDRSPCGAHFAVLVRGRANLEMTADARVVMPLQQGSMIIEGLMADYNARLRAKSACELYRVRQSDFMIAVLSVPAAHEWFYRFRLLERETKERFHMRLKSAQGAEQASIRRPASAPRGLAMTDKTDMDATNTTQRPGTAPQGNSRNRSSSTPVQAGQHSNTLHGTGNSNTLKALDVPERPDSSLSNRSQSRSQSQSRSSSKISRATAPPFGASPQQGANEGWGKSPERVSSKDSSRRRPLQRVGSAPARARKHVKNSKNCHLADARTPSKGDTRTPTKDGKLISSTCRSLPTVSP